MTEAELSGIEAGLGITLPGRYRAAMLAYRLDPADPDAQISLMDDTGAVVAFNRFLREQFAGEWRPSYLAIGNSPSGDTYFLDSGSGAETVWSFDHETHEVAPQAPDFGGWVAARLPVEPDRPERK